MMSRVLIFLLFLIQYPSAANHLDSLRKVLTGSSGKQKVVSVFELSKEFQYNNIDSALRYSKLGVVISRLEKLPNYEGDFFILIGNALMQKGEFAEALKNYIEADKLYGVTGSKKGSSVSTMNIGYAYEVQGIFDKAFDMYQTALDYSKESDQKDVTAEILGHLGSLYYSKNDKPRSLEYFRQALEINQSLNNVPRVMECLNNIAVIYQELGKYEEALQYLNTDLAFARSRNVKIDLVAILHNIGLVYKDKKEFNNAISYIDSAAVIAEEIAAFDELREAYSTLSEIYQEQHNFSRALEFFRLSSAARDSLLNRTRQQQFIEMSTKYETEKKDAENKLLKSESEKQKTILIAISGGLILVGALAFLIYSGYRQKKKANIQLATQNVEIKAQKHIIEEKQTEILDSIFYARRLQDAILPPLNLLHEHLDMFVFYQPKDIVAGDFYWFEKNGNTTFIAAADCTGHGVPGALVSVVCCNALNRAVHEFNLKDPGQILDKTRELVVKTFAKSEKNVRDGMDISLMVIEKDSSSGNVTASWAGANNPVYVISGMNLQETKGDKFHVGAFADEKETRFTTRNISISKGDRVYLFSDGLPDQFGGPDNKKYKYRRLKEKLVETSQLPMQLQKELIHADLVKWQGTREQVDDILLVGFTV